MNIGARGWRYANKLAWIQRVQGALWVADTQRHTLFTRRVVRSGIPLIRFFNHLMAVIYVDDHQG